MIPSAEPIIAPVAFASLYNQLEIAWVRGRKRAENYLNADNNFLIWITSWNHYELLNDVYLVSCSLVISLNKISVTLTWLQTSFNLTRFQKKNENELKRFLGSSDDLQDESGSGEDADSGSGESGSGNLEGEQSGNDTSGESGEESSGESGEEEDSGDSGSGESGEEKGDQTFWKKKNKKNLNFWDLLAFKMAHISDKL